MPCYETTFIARPDISEKDAKGLMATFVQLAEEQSASVPKQEYWGLRDLAYPINKYKRGHYIFLGVDIPSAGLQEVERRLRLHEDIIRNLSVKVDAIDTEPSIILREKDGDTEGERT